MGSVDQSAVERFVRRSRGTSSATLRRNIEANVYGPAGSSRRRVAEEALRIRLAESAGVVDVARIDQLADLAARLERTRRVAVQARRVAIVATALALFAAAYALGWI